MVLSICIPTYNRSKMLSELLDSIIEQITDENVNDVEIAISDNCSSDETDMVLEKYKKENPKIHIIYNKNSNNIGPDRNYIKAVQIANGDYAWILGSDDKINDGALDRVLKLIKDNCDLYLSNRDDYSFDFKNKIGTRYFFKKELNENITIDLSQTNGWELYFGLCKSLGGLCSYLSSFFFNREMFLSIKDYEQFVGTAYVHVYMIIQALLKKKNVLIKIVPKSIVKCRMGNDSFLVNGFQRYMLDYKGYLLLSNIFSNKLLKNSFLNVLVREHPFIPISMILKMNKVQMLELTGVMRRIGYDKEYIGLVKRMSRHKLSTWAIYSDKTISHFYRRIIKK